jgi:hypothetical protein
VGPVEVLVAAEDWVRLLLLTSDPPKIAGVQEVSRRYKSMPEHQYDFRGRAKDFAQVKEVLQAHHQEFVRTAAITKNGTPRRCSFLRSNSPGLYEYTISVVGAR